MPKNITPIFPSSSESGLTPVVLGAAKVDVTPVVTSDAYIDALGLVWDIPATFPFSRSVMGEFGGVTLYADLYFNDGANSYIVGTLETGFSTQASSTGPDANGMTQFVHQSIPIGTNWTDGSFTAHTSPIVGMLNPAGGLVLKAGQSLEAKLRVQNDTDIPLTGLIANIYCRVLTYESV